MVCDPREYRNPNIFGLESNRICGRLNAYTNLVPGDHIETHGNLRYAFWLKQIHMGSLLRGLGMMTDNVVAGAINEAYDCGEIPYEVLFARNTHDRDFTRKFTVDGMLSLGIVPTYCIGDEKKKQAELYVASTTVRKHLPLEAFFQYLRDSLDYEPTEDENAFSDPERYALERITPTQIGHATIQEGMRHVHVMVWPQYVIAIYLATVFPARGQVADYFRAWATLPHMRIRMPQQSYLASDVPGFNAYMPPRD